MSMISDQYLFLPTSTPTNYADAGIYRLERLARNNHDHWARKRIDEGWRCGAMRNDGEKQHPDLVPYDQLPQSEQEYDRKTVVEALPLT